jgi:tRNA(Ile)-lysidine synthase
LLKDRAYLLLTERDSKSGDSISISEEDKHVATAFGTLFFDEADAIFGKRTEVILVDKDKLKFPLTLRKWNEGDYFYPFGMKGKKKLSKFLKDEKCSLIEKEQTWVLISGNDMVWVVGKRADDRFKVTENTSQILKIELQK